MLNYPLEMSFKIVAINPQVRVTDANGQLIAYVKQKAFKLREDITIFADEAQTRPLYRINANRILDFNASYNWNENLTLAFEAINLTDEIYRQHGRTDHQLIMVQQTGPRYMIGARYKFGQ